MDHTQTQMELLTKHIMEGSDNVNVVLTPNMYEDQDIDLDEEAQWLGNQGGFKIYNSENQDYNFENAGQNYSREGQSHRIANREHGTSRTEMVTRMIVVVCMFPK